MAARFPDRALALGLLGVLTLTALGLRVLSSPTGGGYRHAMAAAPRGGIFLADGSGQLLLIDKGGHSQLVARLPTRSALALASQGDRLLLGADDGVFLSDDGGRGWHRAAGVTGRFMAVGLNGTLAVAGAWGTALWVSRDSGGSWSSVQVPPGDTEFESVTLGTTDLVSTELGVLRSTDGGITWTSVAGLPPRMTALLGQDDRVVAGSWDGGLFESADAGATWRRSGGLGAGIWTLAEPGWVGTSTGLFHDQRRVDGPLASLEVTQLVASSGTLYAAVAQGPIYALVDGGWRPIHQP